MSSSSWTNIDSYSQDTPVTLRRRVGVFWDYDQCPPRDADLNDLIPKILSTVAHAHGGVSMFRGYSEAAMENVHPEIQFINSPDSGVQERMLVDVMEFAMMHPEDSTIILITGDRGFTYAATTLRRRRHKVVIISSTDPISESLARYADVTYQWEAILSDEAPQPQSVNPLIDVQESPANPGEGLPESGSSIEDISINESLSGLDLGEGPLVSPLKPGQILPPQWADLINVLNWLPKGENQEMLWSRVHDAMEDSDAGYLKRAGCNTGRRFTQYAKKAAEAGIVTLGPDHLTTKWMKLNNSDMWQTSRSVRSPESSTESAALT